ncbi:MAG: WXG100 family type VII secretion target [Micromonosporaceae bacterium]
MRVEDGGGPNPYSADGKTYHVKVEGYYSSSANGMTAEQAKALVDPTEAGPVVDAGTAFTSASGVLHEVARNLIGHAQRLSGAWSGGAADTAMPQFQQLHDTAINLANASQATGSVLTWHGSTIMGWYKDQINKLAQAKQARLNSGGVLGAISNTINRAKDALEGHDPEDVAAANQMAKYNNRISQAYNSLPATVTKNLPPS